MIRAHRRGDEVSAERHGPACGGTDEEARDERSSGCPDGARPVRADDVSETTGSRSGDPVAAYLGGSNRFDRALSGFAQAYADQNERAFDALGAVGRSGRIHAESL